MNGGWMLDVDTMIAGLSVWLAVVLLHGLWRSRGEAPVDPIRPSGPVFRS